jgi:hypothetical protein
MRARAHCPPLRSKAETVFAGAASGAARRVAVLLTDGRVDAHQAREAAAAAARLEDEQAVRVFALGVGRGVDTDELARIIGGGDADAGAHAMLPTRERTGGCAQDA